MDERSGDFPIFAIACGAVLINVHDPRLWQPKFDLRSDRRARGRLRLRMAVTGMDHVAIPAGDPEALLRFYRALGFSIVHEDEWRSGEFPIFAIACGDQKINVHDPKLWQNPRFELRGPTAEPGCGDFCFVWDGTPESASAAITAAGAKVIESPAKPAVSADAPPAPPKFAISVYTRDPDGNLVELISYGD